MSHSHSQIHFEIQRILDTALDQPLDAETQAALDQHLAGCAECRRYAAGLKQLEARLRPALESRWPAEPLSDGQRASALGKILSYTRRTPMQTHISSTVRTLALGALAILLIVALGWGIRTLRPVSPAGGGGTPVGQTPSVPTLAAPEGQTPAAPTVTMAEVQTPSAPTETTPEGQTASAPTEETPSAPTEAATATLQPVPAGSVRLLPKLQFTFATEFPAAPDQVNVYQQQVSEAITADQARQTALQLGVDGSVIQSTGEGGGPIFEVRGGGSVVRFLGFADQFMYEVIPTATVDNPADLPPFDQQVTIAENFLRQKGLLEGAYRVEPVLGDPGVVRFGQLLEDRPVRYGVGDGRMASPLQWIDVSVTASGEVSSVSYNAHHFQQAGQYPILDAQQAWDRFANSSTDANSYAMYAILSAEKPITYRSWVRDYPVGPVHIYDYASVLQSAEGGAPVVQFSRYPLTGNFQDMITGKFLHAWGQIILDEQGHKTFKVEGWEISTLPDANWSGTLTRQGDTASFKTNDGQTLVVSDLPADVPEGVQVDIRGVALNGTVDWSFIQTGDFPTYYSSMLSCGSGGGGGGETPNADFGGGLLANLVLAGMAPVPTQPPAPYQAGDVVNGQTGIVWVTINKYADHTEIDASMWVDVPDGMTWVANLSGAGLTGIENYQALPIKVWGHVDKVEGGSLYFTVDRYEEAYPGLRIQAWIGTEKAVTLEGKTALLFTTLDGQQFVLKGSIGYGDAVRVGPPGDTVISEGLLIPGLKFGGYPVIQDLAGMGANGRTDLSGYTILSGQPSIIDHTQDVPVVSPASLVEGQVTIQKIELVYLAYSLAGCPVSGANSAMLYVQPVWRFTGQFEDGRRFEVLVQALPDANLTFGMPGG